MYIPTKTPHEYDLFNDNRDQRTTQINKQVIIRYILGHFQIQPSGFVPMNAQKALARQMIKQRNNCLGIYYPSGILVCKVEPHELTIREENKLFDIVITSERQIQEIVSKITQTDLCLSTFRYAADQVYPKILSSELKYYKSYLQRPSENLRRLIDKGQELRKNDAMSQQVLHFRPHIDLRCKKQQEAINASGKSNLMIIDGPAGTGKTKIACKIAIQFSRNSKKVIMGAHTHAASKSIADHILQELIEQYNYNDEIHLMQMIRNLMVYYQANLQAKEQEDRKKIQAQIRLIVKNLAIRKEKSKKLNVLYFDSLLESKEYFSLLLFLRYFNFNSQVLINLIILNEQSSIIDLFINLDKISVKQLTTPQFHELYKAAVRVTIKNADIIITNTAKAPELNDYQREDEYFLPELAILDEARQATLIDTYCMLSLNVNRLILLGDYQQLSTSPYGNYKSLNMNPLKIFDFCQQIPRHKLSKQFRMHPEIYKFAQVMTYGNQIQNGVKKNIIAKHQSDFFRYPLFMVTHYNEQQHPENAIEDGCFNWKQIMIIKLYIDRLDDEEMKNVGIMTFYRAQVSRMKVIFADQMKLGMSISTVDGYQGGQRDYIFLSAVRSNWEGSLGFVQDKNRLNVAFTRARKTLIIVGNAATLQFGQYDNKWKQALNYLQSKDKISPLGEDWEIILQKEKNYKRPRDSTKFRQIQVLDDDEAEKLHPKAMKLLRQKAIANIQKYEVQQLPYVKSRYN